MNAKRRQKLQTQSRCVCRGGAALKMHVRLLKKISTQHFVGQVLATNAIVRFHPSRPLVAQEGALCHVTNCQFDSVLKLVKCDAVGHIDANPQALAQPDVATPAHAPLAAPAHAAFGAVAATAAGGPSTPAAAGGPSKRRRASFTDDEPVSH